MVKSLSNSSGRTLEGDTAAAAAGGEGGESMTFIKVSNFALFRDTPQNKVNWLCECS